MIGTLPINHWEIMYFIYRYTFISISTWRNNDMTCYDLGEYFSIVHALHIIYDFDCMTYPFILTKYNAPYNVLYNYVFVLNYAAVITEDQHVDIILHVDNKEAIGVWLTVN